MLPGPLALAESRFRTAIGDLGWRLDAELDLLTVDLGPDQPFGSVTELVAFVRDITAAPSFSDIRGFWLEPGKALADQLPSLTRARPLTELAPVGSGILADILDENRLETWYQPIFQPGSSTPWGYECLVRARAADGELVMPNELFAWASSENLLFRLDRLCREAHIRNAASASRLLGELGTRCRFLINFLPTVIYEPAFCLASTLKSARESGLDPQQLVFEVVESHRVNVEHLERVLAVYREHGFAFALDDLGAGYSTLSLLGDLDPDIIKVDRSLTQRCVDSELHRTICEAVIGIGRQHGRPVLAEGIETRAQLELLEAMGADLLQGFLLGGPAPEPTTHSAVA